MKGARGNLNVSGKNKELLKGTEYITNKANFVKQYYTKKAIGERLLTCQAWQCWYYSYEKTTSILLRWSPFVITETTKPVMKKIAA
jgi:hypothetical protein